MYECSPGWWKFLDEELKKFYEIDPELTELSVKEKYGRADVHFTTEAEGVWDKLMAQAEVVSKRSQETCELCGNPGQLRNERGWIQCRCDRCQDATREERTEIMRETAKRYENSRRA